MPLRIGAVGGGGIVHAHLPHLQKHPEVELFAVADVNEEAARRVADQYDIARAETDWRAIVDDVDAALVCVPTFLHADIACAFLEAGKAVFCEKPLARTMEQANAMLQAASTRNAPLQVGFVRQYDDEWIAIRDAVQSAKIGRPVVWRDILSGSGPGIAWFNDNEKGGGPFLDGCIHNIEFALSTFGAAQWAFCHGRTLHTGDTAIDTGTATVRFQSGDELLLAWSWGLPAGVGGGRIFEFLGPDGALLWPNDDMESAERRFVVARTEGREDVPFRADALSEGYKRQIEHFVQVAQGKSEPRAGGKQGRDALEVALAILESARSQQLVKIA